MLDTWKCAYSWPVSPTFKQVVSLRVEYKRS